jgi:hypothetical protein
MLKFVQRARSNGTEYYGKNRQHPAHLLKLRKR